MKRGNHTVNDFYFGNQLKGCHILASCSEGLVVYVV